MRRRAKRRRRRWELIWLHFVNLHIVTNCFVVIKRAKRRRRLELSWLHFVNHHIVTNCFDVKKRAKRRRKRLEESWRLAWQHIIQQIQLSVL